jgi:hypothetical protein
MKKNKQIVVGLFVILLLVVAGGLFLLRGNGAKPSVKAQNEILYYYCPMHPDIHKDKPGQCPICNMTLVPKMRDPLVAPTVSGTKGPEASGPRKVKYWVDSMNPSFRSDKPGKAPDGMDLVPVYEEAAAETGETTDALKGLAPIHLTDYKQQLIGVKTVAAARQTIVRTISTVGRRSDLGSGWVADIYSLDIDFVKAGQKAWVTALSGSGPKLEGVVAGLYPFDDTQSRVRRARISVKGHLASPYANVLIESNVPNKLAVPADAVMDTGSHTYVFIQMEPGHFVPREVTVGAKGDDLWEIIDGLKAGETVVSGANFLVDADSRLSAILKD